MLSNDQITIIRYAACATSVIYMEALVPTYSVWLSKGGAIVAERAGDPRKLSTGAQQLRGFDVKHD